MKILCASLVLFALLHSVICLTLAKGKATVASSLKPPHHSSRASEGAPGQLVSGGTLTKILTDRSLWGKDFAASLARIPSWNRVGEAKVVLFMDRAMGNSPYETRQQAEAAAAKLSQAMGMAPVRPVPDFLSMLEGAQQVPFRVEVMPYADDSFHVALIDSSLQLISSDLTPARLEERLGRPERVSTVAIQGKGDRRGVVLTLYQYAGSKVAFAQADLSPRLDFIDRVFLDVPAVMAAAFQEAR